MASLDDIARIVEEVARRVGPAVARVGRAGNGVVVADGRVLTNAHNVRGPEARVSLPGTAGLSATVLGTDHDGDLAVLGADTPAGVAPAAVSAPVRLGSAVLAVAATEDGPRVSVGFVSALGRTFHGPRGRRIGGAIEHTAPLAPGSSGSALVDAQGALVGLNTHRLGAGFYLAIPTDAALLERAEALGRGDAPERPVLGVAVAPAWAARRMRAAVGLEPRDGVLVREVAPGSPAEAAGIAVGDLIVASDERPIVDADDLADAIDAAADGRLELVCLRGAEERRATVSLAARP
jgi:serine protease Do